MFTYYIIFAIAVTVSGIVGFVSGAKYSSVYKEKLAKIEAEIKAVEQRFDVGYQVVKFIDRIKAHL